MTVMIMGNKTKSAFRLMTLVEKISDFSMSSAQISLIPIDIADVASRNAVFNMIFVEDRTGIY